MRRLDLVQTIHSYGLQSPLLMVETIRHPSLPMLGSHPDERPARLVDRNNRQTRQYQLIISKDCSQCPDTYFSFPCLYQCQLLMWWGNLFSEQKKLADLKLFKVLCFLIRDQRLTEAETASSIRALLIIPDTHQIVLNSLIPNPHHGYHHYRRCPQNGHHHDHYH